MSEENIWLGTGNLGANPVMRQTPSGVKVINFSIAIDRVYGRGKGKDREEVKETYWIPVVAWGGLAQVCNDQLQKGSRVFIKGFLRTRSFTAKDGTKRSSFEINAESVTFLARTKSSQQSAEA